ncbi:MAG: ankyrin repeat domain-containing protein [Puniceicoccales bacterium]|jgi:ankyrin repeat protein|nr:ankyrin repeat domain-containing protein [Puniceicoccales bacterium]
MKANKSIIDKLLIRSFLFTSIMGTIAPLQASTACQDARTLDEQRLFFLFEHWTSESAENIRKLIDAGTNINARDDKGYTPLHWAVSCHCLRIVQLLLEKDANIDAQDDEECTPLHRAVSCCYLGIIQLLLKKNANINIKNNKGYTPLHLAVLYHRLKIVHLLLGQPKIDVNAKDHDGSVPLRSAILRKYQEIAQSLIQYEETDINVQDKYDQTPLHWAILSNLLEIVRFLLERTEININVQDKYGQTPLHWAIRGNLSRIIQLVLQWPGINIDVQVRDDDGNTLLHLAIHCWRNKITGYDFNIIEALVEVDQGAMLNEPNNVGDTPLDSVYQALNWNTVLNQEQLGEVYQMIKYLIGKGACAHKREQRSLYRTIKKAEETEEAIEKFWNLIVEHNAILDDGVGN